VGLGVEVAVAKAGGGKEGLEGKEEVEEEEKKEETVAAAWEAAARRGLEPCRQQIESTYGGISKWWMRRRPV
jgi:hypothetical protein